MTRENNCHWRIVSEDHERIVYANKYCRRIGFSKITQQFTAYGLDGGVFIFPTMEEAEDFYFYEKCPEYNEVQFTDTIKLDSEIFAKLLRHNFRDVRYFGFKIKNEEVISLVSSPHEQTLWCCEFIYDTIDGQLYEREGENENELIMMSWIDSTMEDK